MKKSASAFTLIELTVVVVIIAILATVTLITYLSAARRANDSQTLSAAEQWTKVLMNYRVRNGSLPSTSNCLGSGYKYNANGQGASGTGQCRQDSNGGILDNSSFDTLLATYINISPTPSMATTATQSTTEWYRGIYYYVYSNSGVQTGRIDVVLSSVTQCPATLGGIKQASTYTLPSYTTTADGNHICEYPIGPIASY